ncbi:MAG: hypothetical protein V4467_00415 [Patescibacteria group bacterium]
MNGRTYNLKSARLKAKRRKVIIGRIILAVFFFGGLWGSVYYLSGLNFITISDVEVVGATSLATADIASTTEGFLQGRYFFTIPKSNIFFYPAKKIESTILDSYSQVAHVGVSYKNSHAITVSVIERSPKALWCQGKPEQCYFLDDTGLIFSPFYQMEDTSLEFITFYSAEEKAEPMKLQYVSPDYFKKLLDFAEQLSSAGFKVTAFRERPDLDFEADFSGGQKIIFARDADFSLVLKNFQTLLVSSEFSDGKVFKNVEYVDLRFGNKVYYKER